MGQKRTNAACLPIVELVNAAVGAGNWIIFCVGTHLTQVPQPKGLISCSTSGRHDSTFSGEKLSAPDYGIGYSFNMPWSRTLLVEDPCQDFNSVRVLQHFEQHGVHRQMHDRLKHMDKVFWL